MSYYLKLDHKLDYKKAIIATFYIEANVNLKNAVEELAAESSIGTWTELTTLKPAVGERLAAKVFNLDAKKGLAKIAYPLALFEGGCIPQLLSDLAGNIFSLKKIDNLRLIDLEFPGAYVRSFPGPAFGINGIRKITKIKSRPFIGAIMKPKLGLTAREHAELAYEIFKGGVDLVKDDENLTDQSFNPFEERVIRTLASAKRVEKETGQMKICAFNVTAETGEMIRRAKFIKKQGGTCAMIDVVTAGFSAVQTLRKADLGLILHGHRAMHSAFTRNPKHGISMLVLAKLCRLAGIDQLHTGTVVGKMEGEKKEVNEINAFLGQEFFGLKKVLPIASGGLHPGLTPSLIKILGNDVIINYGGGLHGHPDGSHAGALACYQSVEAAVKGISLEKYAETHPELKKALEHWK